MCVSQLFVNQAWRQKLKINLIFLIEPFRYMTKKSRQKLKYLENEKSFWSKIKRFFIIFKRFSVAKIHIKPKSALLKYLSSFWRPLEMPLINCKIELKLNWTKNCVLVVVILMPILITLTQNYMFLFSL